MAQNAYRGRTTRLDSDDLPTDVQDEFLNGKTRSADVLYALLRDCYYKGPVGVGKGGHIGIHGGGSPGTGLRRPDGPLYNFPASWRTGILSRAVDLGLIVQTDDSDDLDDGTFATTPRGRDLLLDADRCNECGHSRVPTVSTSVVELSRYSHSKDYHLVTVCPECESSVGDGYEFDDDRLDTRAEWSEENPDAAIYMNDDPSEFVEDPDEDAVQTDEDDAQDDEDGDDHSDADGDESDEAANDGDDDAATDDDEEEVEDEDPTYEEGTNVRVPETESFEDSPHAGAEGVVESVFYDDGEERAAVRFDVGRGTFDPDRLSTMRPVEDGDDEPDGPEFDDDRPRGDDADACPPVEVVAAEFDALNEAVETARVEGVEDLNSEGADSAYLFEGDEDALRRVLSVVRRLDYAYAPIGLYVPLDPEDDDANLFVKWTAPRWVAPETTRGVYVCAECGAGEVRDGSNVTVSDYGRPDAPRGWDLLLEQEVYGVETRAVACGECGEQGLLGQEDAPWTGGAILSPTVHRTPAKFRS